MSALASESHLLLSQHRNITANGDSVWCETAGWTDTHQFYLVCRDVRHRKKMEHELRAFAICTSADLREPCNGILLIAALLEQCPSLRESAEAVLLASTMRASCGLLLGIVTNVRLLCAHL